MAKGLTVTNLLTYSATVLIATVKSFIVQSLGNLSIKVAQGLAIGLTL